MTGHTGEVTAMATAVLPGGRPVAVTGSYDGTVRVWDLTTGTPTGDPLTGHTGPVMAVAPAVLPGGRPVAVTGSADATVRVWDLATGAPAGDPLTGHTGSVTAVATAVLPGGRPVAVTGSDDATVRVWDLATGTPAGDPLTGHTPRWGRWPPRCCPAAARSRSPPATTPRCGSGTRPPVPWSASHFPSRMSSGQLPFRTLAMVCGERDGRGGGIAAVDFRL